jgi:hypothetical protein
MGKHSNEIIFFDKPENELEAFLFGSENVVLSSDTKDVTEISDDQV